MKTIPCKICGADSPLHGVCDRAKSCEANRGRFFALRGEAVWYHRCSACGFLFTTDFDHWTREDWLREVYNDRYGEVDPDMANGSRAKAYAIMMLGQTHFDHRILDYGGGYGTMAQELRSLGRKGADSWDPIMDDPRDVEPVYDVVTAFEVLEHSPTPVHTAAEMIGFLRPEGPRVLMLSTLLSDSLPEQVMDWWYAAPANGHVSIHTSVSLQRLFGDLNCRVDHLSHDLHAITLRTKPQQHLTNH